MSEMENFKCPNCGGALKFDSEKQKLYCEHCEGTFDADSFSEGKDLKIENEIWDEDNKVVTYTCKSCGGVIMADKDTVATSCPYCGNPLVLSGNVTGEYKPSRIIPFKLDKNQAKSLYFEHLKGKTLLPNEFKSEALIDEIKGIYVPYWIFNGIASGSMSFDATKVRSWSDGNYNYTETSIYKLYRSGKASFSNVPVDASSKVDDDLTQSIEPFDINDAKEFNTNYLAGYLADKYDVDAKTSKSIADNRIANSASALLSSTALGYTTCIPTGSRFNISEGKQEYVMYPLWLLNVKYKDQNYQFAMNGQTGKFVGNLPMDKSKLVKILLLVFFGITALLSLIQFLVIKL